MQRVYELIVIKSNAGVLLIRINPDLTDLVYGQLQQLFWRDHCTRFTWWQIKELVVRNSGITLMRKTFTIILLFVGLFVASSGLAHGQSFLEFSDDRFVGGPDAVHSAIGTDDLFMSGDTIRSESSISGSAHFAGRKIIIEGAIGGDAYAAGMDISLRGPVAGDATIAGYDITVGDIGGDLRVSGQKVELSGQVIGYTLVNGGRVKFDSHVKGDVSLTVREIQFSENAQIEGNLLLFEDEVGETEIPPSVIAADRIERRPSPGSADAVEQLDVWDRDHPIMKFITRLVFVGIVTGLIAALMPKAATRLRQSALAQPLSTLFLGFLALSASIGAAIVLMISGIAFILVPIPLLVAFVGALAGYMLGVYVVGIGTLSAFGRPVQDNMSARVLAAGAGALVATMISRVPVMGWLGTLTITLIGLGALAVWLFRPKFFAPITQG